MRLGSDSVVEEPMPLSSGRRVLYLAVLAPLVFVPELLMPSVTGSSLWLRGTVAVALGIGVWGAGKSDLEVSGGRDWILATLVSYIAVLAVTGLLGWAPWRSLLGDLERMWGTIMVLHLVAFYAGCRLFLDRVQMERLLFGAVLVSGVVAVSGLAQQIEVLRPPWITAQSRVSGVTGNPSYLAVYLGVATGLVGLLWKGRGTLGRLILTAVVLLNVVAFYFAFTRSAILGAAVGGLVGLMAYGWAAGSTRRTRIAWGGAAAGVTVAAATWLFRDTEFVRALPGVGRLAEFSLSDATTRLELWEAALEGTIDHVLFGVGGENFNLIYDQYADPEIYRVQVENMRFDRVHNAYLDAAVGGGVLGFIAYMAIWISAGWSMFRARVEEALSPLKFTVVVGVTAAYLVYLIFWFEHHLSLMLVLALLAYVQIRRDESSDQESGDNAATAESTLLGRVVPILVTVGAVASILYSVEVGRAVYWAQEAEEAVRFTDRVERYEQAVAHARPGTQEVTWRYGKFVVSFPTLASRLRKSESGMRAAERAMATSRDKLAAAIRRDQKNAALHTVAGGVDVAAYYLSGGRSLLKSAVGHIERALELGPSRLQYFKTAADLYLLLGRNQAAARVAEEAYRRFPPDASVLRQVVRAYLQGGSPRGAYQWTVKGRERGLSLSPDLRQRLAGRLREQGYLDQARKLTETSQDDGR